MFYVGQEVTLKHVVPAWFDMAGGVFVVGFGPRYGEAYVIGGLEYCEEAGMKVEGLVFAEFGDASFHSALFRPVHSTKKGMELLRGLLVPKKTRAKEPA